MNFLEQDIFDKTVNECKNKLAEFNNEHGLVIKSLIEIGKYETLIEIIFKQGFIKGMKFSREMRDEIKSKLQ